jgi:polyisoprenoid-binding protein YceI
VSTTTAQTTVPTGVWKADAAHSWVEFGVRHMGFATIRGRVRDFDATVVGGEEPRIEGTLRVASIDTGDAARDGHLQSPDFFDAERHPEVRFVSTAVEADGDELVIRAELTIKGTTEPVELRGRLTGTGVDPWGGERLGIELAGAIDRNRYGVSWNAPLPGGGFLVDDAVQLAASLSAVKAS